MTGKDIIVILTKDGTALASTRVRSQDIQAQCEIIQKASSSQQDWVEVIAGRKSWSITINYLVLASPQISDLLFVGQTFGVTVKDSSSVTSVTGTAIMSSVKNVSTLGNLAQGSFVLAGSGPLTGTSET